TPTDGLSEEQKEKHALQIKEREIAIENLKKMKIDRKKPKEQTSKDFYTISDEEIDLVRKNLKEIDSILVSTM
ncbi:MAG: hypothetical protein VX278_04605, partial [Myxococcota bacterium]|nr:hypothetical protein [Myxococcota bacterium]